MNNSLTEKERKHLLRVKEMDCGVCGNSGPSEAHHIEQGDQYTTIPVCPSCHRDPKLGIHGQKRMWLIHKKTEMSVLNETVRKLLQC